MKLVKFHPHGSVLFVTLSIEEGLLLLSNPLCEAIIKSSLARAQELHPLTICHLLVESTHLHLMAVVYNPDDVPGFIRCFKTESAHALNRLLGRRKRTIWCEGYDSPVVLTPQRAVLAIAYIYSNPAKDNLEDSIDLYQGFSTWKMFIEGKHQTHCHKLHRSDFYTLPKDSHSKQGYERTAQRLLRSSPQTLPFVISPNAWLDAFGITDQQEQQDFNQEIINHVRQSEDLARQKRLQEQKPFMGAARLKAQVFNLLYRPERKGRRSWCISDDIKLRVAFIQLLKDLREQAKAVFNKWREGYLNVPYPPGLYPPALPKFAEPVSVW